MLLLDAVDHAGAIVVRLVTDSNAMLPPDLVDHFDVLVVPLTVVVDGVARLEDEVDLAAFYARLRDGAPVTTAAPSPGELLDAYQRAVDEGADEVLSVHIGSNQSATVGAAHVASEAIGLPVTIVDTGTASFIEGCCAWRAAEVLTAGGGVGAAATAAQEVAASAASVFTIGEITRALRSGRLDVLDGSGVPVFASAGPDMAEIGRATTQAAAVAAMVERVGEAAGPLRVGVGHADAPDDAAALEASLRSLPQVAEVTRYVVGPSVAAHTGAGTFGAVYHPI